MSQLIACPECGKHLQVPDDLMGKQVQCPECRQTFHAAAPNPTPALPKKEPPAEPPDEPAWEKKTSKGSRTSKKTRRNDDDDNTDDDRNEDRNDLDIRRRRRGSNNEKPGKVTGLGVMALVGGILAVMLAIGWGAGSFGMCCLWPGTYYSLVVGILAIIKGSALLGQDASSNPPPTGIAIMMIINIVNLDFVNLVLGIVMLVFCNDDEVTDYLA